MAIIKTLFYSMDFSTAVGNLLVLTFSYIFYNIFLYPNYISPLRHIPGPPNKSKYNKYGFPIYGLLFDVIRSEPGVAFRKWTEQYGDIICFPSMFNTRIVHTANPEAIRHVLQAHTYQYPKTDRVIRVMSTMTGIGLLLAEGDTHKKQRKFFTPVFSHMNIKKMVHTMVKPAEQLSKIWKDRINGTSNGSVEINVSKDLSPCILDILGLAAFGHDFKALENPDIPTLRCFDEYFNDFEGELEEVFSKKRALAASGMDDGIDLISIMLRSAESEFTHKNLLSNEDLLTQAKTFIGAGHDTTCMAIVWMLYILSTHPKVQARLRQEFLTQIGRPTSESKNTLSYDALNGLPYLNVCVKELLRLIPPVPCTSRVATQDDEILGYHIPKGTEIWISQATLHTLKSVYGDDAEEFKPERWMDPSELTEEQRRTTKTVTSDMMWAYIPFLAGPRSCIGSKLALIEIKIVLYYLLCDFEYFPVPGFKFRKATRISLRPSPGMNLIVKKYEHEEAPSLDRTVSMLNPLSSNI
ncbi:hypothetical protein FBU30_004816 [Linnemannia zychae]|nr:hypothetical protein FBU30_004816 [Linnemannia zychae]